MLTEKEKLDSLASLGIELNRVNDLDILMEQILQKARTFVNADAGSIYIREGRDLQFTYTQNDTLQQRLAKGEKLIYSTFKIPIDKQSIAGHVALTGDALNIPDVYKMNAALPYKFSRKFDEATSYKTQSVLTIPLENAKKEVLGILQIINAQDKADKVIPFSNQDVKMMYNFAGIASVALERAQMTRALVLRMIRMAEMRDPKETGAHVNRVAGFAVELYEQWASRHGISQEEIDRNRDILHMAAMLHDAGKVGISDLILKKPGKLDNDEYSVMKNHVLLGAQLFMDGHSDFDEASAVVSLNHHERWDGNGYPGYVDVMTGRPLPGYAKADGTPRGKRRNEIPIFGRVTALADVFDALSSARVYKKAWDEDKVLSIIKEESGAQFDPELVDILLENLKTIRAIQKRYKE